MSETTSLRTCSKCSQAKPLSDFYIDKRWNIPFRRCKECHTAGCRPVADVPITPYRVKHFWSKVGKAENKHDCWPWLGLRIKGGYGKCNKLRTEQLAHRVAWMLINGPIPEGLEIMHTCDNPPCCNPYHLAAATHKENVQDCIDKGRFPTGERSGTFLHPEKLARGASHPRAKLTEDDIPTIRSLLSQGVPLRTIAKQYGVGPKTIFAIKIRRTWTHVP